MTWDELLKILTGLKESGSDMAQPVCFYSGEFYFTELDIVQSGRSGKFFLVQEQGADEE